MDRTFLAQAERHVSEGEKTIAHQPHIIAELERDGHDATAARKPLSQFEGLLAAHIAQRDRRRQELGSNDE